MWHPDSYLEEMYRSMPPLYRFQASNAAEWSVWRRGLVQRFSETMGGFPAQPAKLDTHVLEEIPCEGYMRQRVEFTTYAGLRMPAYVLIPENSEGALMPAVIACHGHGYGSKEIVGLAQDGINEGQMTYQQNFAIELVKRGFVTVVPELLGFGDRRLKAEFAKEAYSSCDAISTFLLQMGFTMSGHRIYETLRAIDYLGERADVDQNRIGCMGISGGGLVAGFAAALDERIHAVVVSGFVNSFKASILSIHHCIDNYIPGLNRYAEMADLLGLIAPRPLFVEAGKLDPIFPIAATEDAYMQIRNVYRLLGEERKLDADFFDGEHRINGLKTYEWLAHWLR